MPSCILPVIASLFLSFPSLNHFSLIPQLLTATHSNVILILLIAANLTIEIDKAWF